MSNLKQIDSPEFELPVPVGMVGDELKNQLAGGENVNTIALEHGKTTPPPTDPAQNVSSVTNHSNIANSNATQQQISSVNPRVSPTASLIADDGDLIEKEWVIRAKHIVESTKHDPHQQNKQLGSAGADYMKKRFDHNMKTEEV